MGHITYHLQMLRQARTTRPPTYSQATKKKRVQVVGKNTPSVKAGGGSKLVGTSLPDWYRVNLIYGANLVNAMTPGAPGVASRHVFSLNGLFDPDITGGGHQCAGFDQIMGMYDRYLVKKAVIKVAFTAFPMDMTNVTVGISVTDEITTSTDIQTFLENGDTQWGVLSRDWGSRTFTMEVDIAKYAARDIWNEESFEGNSLNNPNNQVFLYCWAVTNNLVTGSYAPITICAQISYDTVFRGAKFKPLS